MPIYTEGPKTAPAAGDLLAQTLPTGRSTKPRSVLVSASAACVLEVQHRNAANDANLYTRQLHIAANTPTEIGLRGIIVAGGERVRVVMQSLLALGNVEAQIVHMS